MKETKTRSLIKSISWRFLAVLNGWIVAFLFLSDTSKSFKISLVANFVGFVLYYIHERVWNFMKGEKND